jgi:endonuclease YncB( thermonuclease family)
VRLLVALLAMALVSAGTHATEQGAPPRIVGGDTLAIGTTKIHLVGIDAPETEQVCLNAQAERWSCGIEARDWLSAHIADREIRCV